AGRQSYLRPASLVPGRTACQARIAQTELLCLERYGYEVCRDPGHLPGYGKVKLALGPGGRGILVASFFLASTRSELRHTASLEGRLPDHAFLAGYRRGWPATRCGALPV